MLRPGGHLSGGSTSLLVTESAFQENRRILPEVLADSVVVVVVVMERYLEASECPFFLPLII